MSKARSFAEFKAAEKRIQCATCVLPAPLLKEVNEARAGGGSYGAISRWLKSDRGTSMSEGALRNHFTAGHGK